MKTIPSTLIAAAFGLASVAALAADPGSDQSRQDRMDQAYSDYQSSHPGSADRMGRSDNSMSNGAHRAGNAIKRGAEKVEHAVGTGLRKTGNAIKRGGEKLQGDSATKQ